MIPLRPSHVLLLTACFLLSPLVLAHEPAGTPKTYCEPRAEWAVHDYEGTPGPVASLGTAHSGNTENCNGTTNPGTPCIEYQDPDDPLSVLVGVCDFDPPPPTGTATTSGPPAARIFSSAPGTATARAARSTATAARATTPTSGPSSRRTSSSAPTSPSSWRPTP